MTITFDVLEMLTNILIASFVVFLLSGSVFVYGIRQRNCLGKAADGGNQYV